MTRLPDIRPQLSSWRRVVRDECPAGHRLIGRNRREMTPGGKVACRACIAARQWARRNNRFNDDPEVLARADAQAAKLVKQGVDTPPTGG